MPSYFKLSRTDGAQEPGPPERAGFARAGVEAPSPAQKNLCAYQTTARLPLRVGACLSVLFLSIALPAQTLPAAAAQNLASPQAAPPPAQDASKPSISLSPAVIMAKGNFGQGLTQTLTLSNQTGRDFAFELVAEDVIIKDGKRVFVPAGETPNSIATTAVFCKRPFSSSHFLGHSNM